MFNEIHLCVLLVQGIYIIFIDQMPAFRVFRKVHSLLALRIYRISRPIRRTMIFSLEILEKNNDECILILVIYWKKTGLLHTKISNHNVIYSS